MTGETVLRAKPVQGRAKARVAAIQDAAREHYAAVGRDRFSFDAVAALVGCSVATIYRYYSDRVALMDDVFPDRDDAERKLRQIEELRDAQLSPTQKWREVQAIIES